MFLNLGAAFFVNHWPVIHTAGYISIIINGEKTLDLEGPNSFYLNRKLIYFDILYLFSPIVIYQSSVFIK